MSNDDFTATIELIHDLEEQQAAITAELDELKAKAKEHMKTEGLSKVRVSKYNVSYSEYESKRFDSTRFKTEHPDTYTQYVKATQTTRLTISLIKK